MADRPRFSEPTPEGALPPDPGPQPNLPATDLSEAGDRAAQAVDLELTSDQRALLAQSLFAPTVKRIVILMTHVVRMTQNGDLVLWLAMSSLDAMLRDMRWEAAMPGAGDKFLALVVRTLRVYADRLDTHRAAWAAWEADGRHGAPPAIVPFDDQAANQIYLDIDAEFATPERPVNRTVVRDMLLLVIDETDLPGSGTDVDKATTAELAEIDRKLAAIVDGWTDEECRDAQAWAANVHLRAGDHNVDPIERPAFIGAAKKAP